MIQALKQFFNPTTITQPKPSNLNAINLNAVYQSQTGERFVVRGRSEVTALLCIQSLQTRAKFWVSPAYFHSRYEVIT